MRQEMVISLLARLVGAYLRQCYRYKWAMADSCYRFVCLTASVSR